MILQQPLPQDGAVSIRTQADEEPELKQLWIERWKERWKVRWKERWKEKIQQRRKGMLYKVELDFEDEEL